MKIGKYYTLIPKIRLNHLGYYAKLKNYDKYLYVDFCVNMLTKEYTVGSRYLIDAFIVKEVELKEFVNILPDNCIDKKNYLRRNKINFLLNK